MNDEWDQLIQHIATTCNLTPSRAERVVADVLAGYAETVDVYVRRRHAELAATGQKNPTIFQTLQTELGERRFAAPVLSERQIRRIIYG